MDTSEQKDRQRLYERTRDEINAATRTMSENLDRSLLALSSGFLGGSLAFVNQVVNLTTAQFKLMLFCSWGFFAASIVATVTSLVVGVLQQRPLTDAAEKYYMQGIQSAWATSRDSQQVIYRWVVVCSALFVIGILLLSAFVVLNLSRGP